MTRGRKLVAGLAACAAARRGGGGERSGCRARPQRRRPRGVQLGDAGRGARDLGLRGEHRLRLDGARRAQARARDVDRRRDRRHHADRAAKRFSATVPVYVHVINKGHDARGRQRAGLADPGSRSRVLNQTFNGMRGGADTNFNFVLRDIDRTTNEAWFNMAPSTSERARGQARPAPRAAPTR